MVASWLPAVVVVPLGMAALVEVSQPKDTAGEAMRQVHPLDPGTTWVYAVNDHGRPSGTRVRQVLGPSQIVQGGVREAVRLSSVYDDYPGRGRQVTEAYLGVEGTQMLQYGLIAGGENLEVTPPAPAYRLPATVGTSWSYDGLVGQIPLKAESSVTSKGDVQVSGRTFEGCTEWTSIVKAGDAPTKGDTETLVEWTCPEIGVVRSITTSADGDTDIAEELVEFHGVGDDWAAEPQRSKTSTNVPATAAGFDQARSHAVPDGALREQLAWTDSRDTSAGFAPVSDGTVSVVGEQDGLVSARDVDNGELRWQVSLPPPVVASPAIAGDVVVVADGAKNVWALSLVDGATRWVHSLDDIVSVAPAVGDDVVAVAVEDGTVSALSREDGEELWAADLGGRPRTAPAVDGNLLVVGDDSGTLSAYDLSSGAPSWSVGLQDGLHQGPTISSDRVLAVDSTGVITAYRLEDGDVQWQARGRDRASEALAAGSAQVVTVGEDGRVEAFALEDGRRQWTRQFRDLLVAPAIIGDQVVLVNETGTVRLLDLGDGTESASWPLPRPTRDAELSVDTPLGVVDGSLVITADVAAPNFESTSYAYRIDGRDTPAGVAFAASGVHVFEYPLASPPVMTGGDVIGLGTDGVIHRNSGLRSARKVAGGIRPAFGFAAEEDLVVAPSGEEIRAFGPGGTDLWTLPATEAYVESIPAIAGDTAFVPLHGAGLAALDARTGQPRWLVPLDAATGSSRPLPLQDGDVAYAANGLARFDGTTGDEVWRLGGDLSTAVAYSPLDVDAGIMFAVLVSADPTAANGERVRTVAVDADSGRVRWQQDMQGSAFAMGAVAGGGVVIVVDSTNLASVLDGRTGEVRWTYQLDTVPGGRPVVHDGVVLLAERGRGEDLLQRDCRITAHDLETGEFLGVYEPPGASSATLPTVGSTADGKLLVPTVDSIGGNVVVLEPVRD